MTKSDLYRSVRILSKTEHFWYIKVNHIVKAAIRLCTVQICRIVELVVEKVVVVAIIITAISSLCPRCDYAKIKVYIKLPLLEYASTVWKP